MQVLNSVPCQTPDSESQPQVSENSVTAATSSEGSPSALRRTKSRLNLQPRQRTPLTKKISVSAWFEEANLSTNTVPVI
eukprot:SAG31_NODE_34859_length_328_cov_1.096070_1_plen_78_part_10